MRLEENKKVRKAVDRECLMGIVSLWNVTLGSKLTMQKPVGYGVEEAKT
jgi:hypothetical protein